jgi:pantothenate kinase
MSERIAPRELWPRLAEALGDRRRLLVALAAPPAAGKSTLAERLRRKAEAALGPGVAAVVPMDGFHLDNAVLSARGLLARKGAPETFDAAGFVALVERLRWEQEVVVPLFDRARDLAVAGAAVVEARHRLVIVEGNYLLLDRPPWDRLAGLWDLSVAIEVPLAELERRLVGRWLAHGLERGAAEARARGNDLPNAELVLEASVPADLVVGGAEAAPR